MRRAEKKRKERVSQGADALKCLRGKVCFMALERSLPQDRHSQKEQLLWEKLKKKSERRARELLFPPVKKTPPAATSASTSGPTVKSSVSKPSASQSKPSQANIPSSSTGGTGKFDKQPVGAVSHQAQTEQQIKKVQFKKLKQPVRAAEEVMEVDVSQPTLTPTATFHTKASASAFHHLTQNVADAQIQLTILSEEGGVAVHFVLDLSKCFTSGRVRQFVDHPRILPSSSHAN